MSTPDAKPGEGAAPAPSEEEIRAQLRRLTRRGFAVGGVSLLAGYGAWRWLVGQAPAQGLSRPLRRILESNEAIARGLFRPSRRAPEFAAARAREPRVNGMIGLEPPNRAQRTLDPAVWRLRVSGDGQAGERSLTIGEIRALPRHEQTTELKCVEGWSTIVTWAGARLADLAAATGLGARSGRPYDPLRPPGDLAEYAALATPDGGYFVGLDMASALHPQTLLCYEMNGEPLAVGHGAPLRLAIPLKYGIKSIKWIGTIRFTDRRPEDYWAERGYDWYAGH